MSDDSHLVRGLGKAEAERVRAFYRHYDWDRFTTSWSAAMRSYGIDPETIVRTVEIGKDQLPEASDIDGWRQAVGLSGATGWWRRDLADHVADVVVQDVSAGRMVDRGACGLSRGQEETATALISCGSDPEAICATMVLASHFERFGGRNGHQDDWNGGRHMIRAIDEDCRRALGRAGLSTPWTHLHTDVLPASIPIGEITIGTATDYAMLLAAEHALTLHGHVPVRVWKELVPLHPASAA